MEHLSRQRDWKGLGKVMNGAFLCVETALSDGKVLNIQTSCPIIDDPNYMDIKIQVDMCDDTVRIFSQRFQTAHIKSYVTSLLLITSKLLTMCVIFYLCS